MLLKGCNDVICAGFISLDCGGEGGYDDTHGISWTSDEQYIKSQPKFELLIDANPWVTVVINNSRQIITKEIIAMARSSSLSVCVAKSTDDVPFISALEFPPIKAIYNLRPNAIREFNINIDGYTWATDRLKVYPNSRYTFGSWEFSSLGNAEFSLDPTNRSTKGAILNALEIYRYSSPLNNGTYAEDANALADIARHFNLEKEWMCDPCLPQKYSWDWVDCNEDSLPKIIAVQVFI
ncbi:hypothetical protein SUGI_0949190 [Cryptomeria japonica]|nr:hypothetical protein SUGI_0949190 [Cryptomeria japonica]